MKRRVVSAFAATILLCVGAFAASAAPPSGEPPGIFNLTTAPNCVNPPGLKMAGIEETVLSPQLALLPVDTVVSPQNASAVAKHPIFPWGKAFSATAPDSQEGGPQAIVNRSVETGI